METSTEKTSADLQREIDQDRQRIGNRIDAIQERMSPGQMIDEVLAYAKGSGGGEYASNLGKALKNNPLPVALMGVSLAWLMAKGSTPAATSAGSQGVSEYPLYRADGPLRRLGPPEAENGSRYSYFSDSTGKKLKALTDETGRRAGHFVDEAGATYRGFADASGKQVEQIADETGAMLDAASGWLSDKWERAKGAASDMSAAASGAVSSVSNQTSSATASLRGQTDKLNDAILRQFRDQPLVGGALAFAVGAAIGAALPHTEMEDDLLGDAADSTKDKVTAASKDVVDRGKEVASEAYDKVVEVASDTHDIIKDRVVEEVDSFKHGMTEQKPGQP
ncbi:DUF3618 domain-containing protein [Pararhizobium sp. DWP3-4]|uniref:DUF3618 domain-containing protein n=1 Tax=unclassified Pararhizobium TaxID=2643050 RepID=UPI003CF113F8